MTTSDTAFGNTNVLIIGGGIIGTSCAYELVQRGFKVTVIDKGEIGHGCSHSNAGWITPCFALPLPMPGMLLQSIKRLTDPDSPLYIKPVLNWALIRWLMRFSLSMNKRLMHQSIAALTELAKYSLLEYRRLDAELPGEFGFTEKGLLMLALTEAGLAAGTVELEIIAKYGIVGRKLDAAQTRQLEPAVTGPIVGSIYFPDQAHAEPLTTVRMLMKRAMKLGASFLPKTELFEFNCRNGSIESVRTTRGEFHADQFILASGAWSPRLAAKLGLRVPVLSGKGYAVEMEPFEPKPTIPLMLIEKKIGVTPRRNSIRFAGTLELVELDESITARRVEAIVRGAKAYLSVPEPTKVIEIWRSTLIPSGFQGFEMNRAFQRTDCGWPARWLLDGTLEKAIGKCGSARQINPAARHEGWLENFSAVSAGTGVRAEHVGGSTDARAAYLAMCRRRSVELGSIIISTFGTQLAGTVVDELGRSPRLNGGEIIAPLFGLAHHL